MLPTTLLFLTLAFDLDSVKAEPNPDRRAELALDNANAALDQSKSHYKVSAYQPALASLHELRDSVELCYEALKSTGKDPRKNSRQFKKIEQRIQLLIRRVKGYEQEVSLEDRPDVKKVQNRLEDINDEIVSGIFAKPSK